MCKYTYFLKTIYMQRLKKCFSKPNLYLRSPSNILFRFFNRQFVTYGTNTYIAKKITHLL